MWCPNFPQNAMPFFRPANQGGYDKRFPLEDQAQLTSEHSVRGVGRTQPFCWMGDHYSKHINPKHSTSQQDAFFKWGQETIGAKTSGAGARDSGLLERTYERNQTALPDVEMQMKFGRPNTGYYAQRHARKLISN